MRKYDFNTVFSPLMFENFARDIIQRREGIILESFAEGRDGGVDNRYVDESGETIIVQTKNRENMNRRIESIMKREKKKMDKLVQEGKRVDRYILVLGDNISPKKKEDVMKIMSPYIKRPHDIVLKEDLNNFLAMPEYQDIERNYSELWSPSMNIIVKNGYQIECTLLLGKSKDYYQEMLDKKKFFVKTNIFDEVVLKAQKNRVVIISGEPGVGKTTLAEQVVLYYLEKYKSENFIKVSSMEEVDKAFSIIGKKVILYDDFWGSNRLDQLIAETSNHIVSIVERIKRNKDCILVMTTREYILEQGLEQNEELRNLVAKYKLECRITQYSEVDKLRIYYGQLKNAGLTWNQVNALKEEEYAVIYSRNYNPRVIEQFLKIVEIDGSPKICVEKLERDLKCPENFWKNIFRGLSKEAQILFVMMAIVPLPIEMNILKECYDRYIETKEEAYEWKNFSDTVMELEKTVIRTDLYNKKIIDWIVITFQNPSVKDFLIYFLRMNFVQYRQVLEKSCQYYAQYIEYLKLLDEIDVSIGIYEKVFEKAIGSLETESIGFYDKYRMLLVYEDQMKKYYDNYQTDQDYRDVGLGRILQLLTMYKEGCSKGIKDKIKHLFKSVVIGIVSYPEIVVDEDLRMIPKVITTMYQTGICEQILPMLEIYMDNLMRNRKSISDIQIKRECPNIWKQYIERNEEKIADYLEKYYDTEICLAAVENDMDGYWYATAKCEECYEEYHMIVPETLKQKIELYDSWIEDIENIEETEEISDKNDTTLESIETVEEEFEDNYLNVIYPDWIENEEEWEQQIEVLQEVKKELQFIDENGHIIWNEFMYDKDSIEFFAEYAKYAESISEDLVVTIRKINQYLTEKCRLDEKELRELAIRLDKYVDGYKWSQREMEDIFSDLLMGNEDFLTNMVDAKVLIHHEQWYRWLNTCLPECIKFATKMTDKENRDLYQSVKNDLLNGELFRKDDFYWKILYQIDRKKFETYILISAANMIYKEIYDEKERWLKNLITFLGFQYEFEEDECVGGMLCGDASLRIIKIYLNTDIFNNIEEKFSEKNIKKLKQSGLIQSEREKLTLEKIEEKGLLIELGIYEELEIFWKKICEWKEI